MSEGFRKYVLADAVKSTAQIFVGDDPTERAFRLDTPRKVPLYLRHTFQDAKGTRKVTRYKSYATSIDQTIQIKENLIPANEPFTIDERGDLEIINGVLIADEADEIKINFLSADNNPQRVDFTGRNRGGVTGIFMELDEEAMADEENDLIFKTAEALQLIKKMSEDEAAAYISLFRGSSYPVPARLKERQNLLAKDLENNEQKIDMILNSVRNQDDEVTILLSKAINQGVILFEQKPNYVSIKRGDQWQDAKMISSEQYNYEEREILFRQHLASPEGELLRKDIEKLVNNTEAAKPAKGKK